jgi:hypothetical protein
MGVKLSVSLRRYGFFRVSAVTIIMVIANPRMSFTVKYGWIPFQTFYINFICITYGHMSIPNLMLVRA